VAAVSLPQNPKTPSRLFWNLDNANGKIVTKA
jgi:hypothetical protein